MKTSISISTYTQVLTLTTSNLKWSVMQGRLCLQNKGYISFHSKRLGMDLVATLRLWKLQFLV